MEDVRLIDNQTYWNLDGFANNETALALNHSLWLPYGGQRVGTDTILIPTGDILANQPGSLNDFWSTPKQIGANFTNPDLLGNCGENCTGYGISQSLLSLHLHQRGYYPSTMIADTEHRYMLPNQPRRTLQLARRRRPTCCASSVCLVRPPSGRLYRPRSLPSLLLRRPKRVHGPQVDSRSLQRL
jgi:hypothetical protein